MVTDSFTIKVNRKEEKERVMQVPGGWEPRN